MDVLTSNPALKILVLNSSRVKTADEAVALVQLDGISHVGAAAGIAHALAKFRSERPVSNVDQMAVDRSSGTDCLGLPLSSGLGDQPDRNHRLVMD